MALNTCAVMDIGSNGVRYLWGRVNEPLQSKRIALRLGKDAFESGRISEELSIKLKKAVLKFSKLIKDKKISRYRVIGTSALREAQNGNSLRDSIKNETGVEIEIIDAEEEARLIQVALKQFPKLLKNRNLVLDIGGGSAEYILIRKGKQVDVFTEPLGTVRLLTDCRSRMDDPNFNFEELVSSRLGRLRNHLDFFDVAEDNKVFIATGGNPRAIGRLAVDLGLATNPTRVSRVALSDMISRLKFLTIEERMIRLGLNADRADVILPAAIVLRASMEASRIDFMELPPLGVKEGLFFDLVGQS